MTPPAQTSTEAATRVDERMAIDAQFRELRQRYTTGDPDAQALAFLAEFVGGHYGSLTAGLRAALSATATTRPRIRFPA